MLSFIQNSLGFEQDLKPWNRQALAVVKGLSLQCYQDDAHRVKNS